MRPYIYQTQAIQHCLETPNSLVVSPPGSGKTVMICGLARAYLERRKKVLIVSQRREILAQTIKHLGRMGVDTGKVGTIYPKSELPDRDRPLQVASMATLIRRNLQPQADLVILDEAHHAVADAHHDFLRSYPNIMGFTATPMRIDGRGLGDVFHNLYIAAQPSELIRRNMLAKPRCFTTPEEFLPNLVNIKRIMGDFIPSVLAERVNQEPLVGNIIKHYKEKLGGTAIVFAAGLDHSRSIVARFQQAGIPAQHLDGDTPLDRRDQIVKDFKAGHIKVLCNVGILHEGFDFPEIQGIILARPTLSLGLYLQQTGRALRKAKHTPIILDHARNIIRLGLPEADRVFKLTTTVERDVGNPSVRVCPECGALISSACTTCPECNHVLRILLLPEETNHDLRELHLKNKRVMERKLREFCKTKNWDEAWVNRVVEAWTAYNSEGLFL